MADTEQNKIDPLDDELLIDLTPTTTPSIIKVIGVGGGGGNAVANMYREGIRDVNFLVCNTDSKALESSPVPHKLQLGPGLGAGGNPVMGRELAEKSVESIDAMLGKQTKMVFITAGMGGGTGTGASPVIAREAKARGILTVGIVTIPFLFEMERQIDKALDGVERLAKEVDALLIINNERLKEIYADLTILNAFRKADEILSVAVRSIVEIIKMHGIMTLDFRDVDTILRNGGIAIMSSGRGSGERRLTKAIQAALHSPLLNNNDIYRAKRFMMNITFNPAETEALTMEETNEVEDFMRHLSPDVFTKWGLDVDPSLGSEVKVTILASGFSLYDEPAALEESQDVKDAELEGERSRRRHQFYGQKNDGRRERHYNIFLYDAASLEDEELISLVDDAPTYLRDHRHLKLLRDVAVRDAATAPPAAFDQ